MPHPFLSAEFIGDRVYECFDLKDYVLPLIIGVQSFYCVEFQKKTVFKCSVICYIGCVNFGYHVFVVVGISEKS